MSYTYIKRDKQKIILRIRLFGLGLFIFGLLMLFYFAFPMLSWKLYSAPAFASSSLQTPVPKNTVLTAAAIKNLLAIAMKTPDVDYNNAQNWFPQFTPQQYNRPVITSYMISIPSIGVSYANVSTIDTDLSKHLVHYSGTTLPPERGNAIIFGHSTLPQLFNPHDYKTIFAKAHTLKDGDTIVATVNGKEYTYKIQSIKITTPDDTSVFSQEYDDSYITIVTCTPPGTTWKRLIIKAKLEK
jgi:sortase A